MRKRENGNFDAYDHFLQEAIFDFTRVCVRDGSGNPFAEFTEQKIATDSPTAQPELDLTGNVPAPAGPKKPNNKFRIAEEN